MLRNVGAVIFDMDGVIIDSEPVHFRIEKSMFELLGFALSPQEHESFLGKSSHETFTVLKTRFGFSDTIETLVKEERSRYFTELESGKIPTVSGVEELIAELSDAGMPLAIASSAPHEQIDSVVEQYDIARRFIAQVSGDDVPRSKPDPAIFLRAADLLDAKPGDCLVIEDSAAGVMAAKAAGMMCIAFESPTAPSQDLSGADARASSMADVRRLILG